MWPLFATQCRITGSGSDVQLPCPCLALIRGEWTHIICHKSQVLVSAEDELECGLNVSAGRLKSLSCQRVISDAHVMQLLQPLLAPQYNTPISYSTCKHAVVVPYFVMLSLRKNAFVKTRFYGPYTPLCYFVACYKVACDDVAQCDFVASACVDGASGCIAFLHVLYIHGATYSWSYIPIRSWSYILIILCLQCLHELSTHGHEVRGVSAQGPRNAVVLL